MSKRIHLMPIGQWSARDGRGPYKMLDVAAARRVVAATMAHLGTTRMMIDYDHQFARAPAVGGTAAAAGWVTALHAEPDGIWGDVEWTAAASAMIEAREYRYLSPYFKHGPDGSITRIVNAGLVNVPAFELASIASSIDGHAVLDLPLPVDALTAFEREVVAKMGLTEADYLSARKSR